MSDLRVDDFDFPLPPELIAQQPPAERGLSRMLVVDRTTGVLRDARFAEFPAQLQPGDLLVLNDSRVIPARLYAKRTVVRDRQEPSGQIEVLLTEPAAQGAGENLWRALVKPGKKVNIGERLAFPSRTGAIELEAEVLERGEFGERLLRFAPVDDFFAALDRIAREQAALAKFDPAKLTSLNACVARQDETLVQASAHEASSLGVDGTPALFIDGERISGAVPEEQIWLVIDRALRAAGLQPAAPAKPALTAAAK